MMISRARKLNIRRVPMKGTKDEHQTNITMK
jgi:hypothetical protein